MVSNKPNYLRPTSLDCISTKGFWEGLRRRQLLARKCPHCGEVFFPPRSHCPHCLGSDLQWVELSGKGTIHSWTEVHVAGPEFDTPYLLGLVDLSEGVGRIASKLVGVEAHQLRLGMPVRIVYRDTDEGFTLYQFTPEE
ncbi:Zn-ribbon domain-containing OB-fold protein [Chloroflexota bacterium]